MIKFGESFSLDSLLNQSLTYQGNPCGVYPDLYSFIESDIIQISIACIKRSVPSQDRIIWYQILGSWYRFYPILLFFFVICLKFVFCHCFVICILVCDLLGSCLCSCFRSYSCPCYVLVLVLVLVFSCFFQILCQKKNCFKFYYKFCLGTIWLTGRI